MKENDATQFLKAYHKEFAGLLSKGVFELAYCSIVLERDIILLVVWAMKKKRRE